MWFRVASVVFEMFHAVSQRTACARRHNSVWFSVASVVFEIFHVARGVLWPV